MDFLADHPLLGMSLVFLARVCDVSLGTLRTILVFRAYRVRSAVIGFFESLIWLTAAGMVLRNMTGWHMALGYAAGYATGNYVGIWLESKLAMGMELVRVISTAPDVAMAAQLRDGQFSVVELDGRGDDGNPIEVLFVVEQRRRLPKLIQRIESTDPSAIYTITDVKVHRSSTASSLGVRRMFGGRK